MTDSDDISMEDPDFDSGCENFDVNSDTEFDAEPKFSATNPSLVCINSDKLPEMKLTFMPFGTPSNVPTEEETIPSLLYGHTSSSWSYIPDQNSLFLLHR